MNRADGGTQAKKAPKGSVTRKLPEGRASMSNLNTLANISE